MYVIVADRSVLDEPRTPTNQRGLPIRGRVETREDVEHDGQFGDAEPFDEVIQAIVVELDER